MNWILQDRTEYREYILAWFQRKAETDNILYSPMGKQKPLTYKQWVIKRDN